MSQAMIMENFEQKTFTEFKNIDKTTVTEVSEETEWIKEDFPWLDCGYMAQVLRKFFKDESLKIKSAEFKSVTAKGDNYGGIMLRAYVIYYRDSIGERSTSYVLKTQIWNDLTSKTMKVYDIHNKEMYIYEKILPRIRDLLVSIGEQGDLFPETVYVDRINDVIVFEDLLLKNYVVKNKKYGFDHEHILLGLEKLAKIHAASAVLYEEDNSIYDSLKSGMFTRDTDVYYTFFRSFWDTCAATVCNMQGYEKYGNKMQAISEQMIEYANRVYDRIEGDFHVMTHGDLWTTNLMFNYKNCGKLNDCVIVSDF